MTTPWIVGFGALCAFVVLLSMLVLGLFRTITPLLERTEKALSVALERVRVTGLPQGALVPSFAAATTDGVRFEEADLKGESSVVLFLGSGCTSCDVFIHDLSEGRVPGHGGRLIVVVNDERDAQLLSPAAAAGAIVLLERDHNIARAFESDRTPHAFVVDATGVVRGSAWPNTWDGIDELVVASGGGDVSARAIAAAM